MNISKILPGIHSYAMNGVTAFSDANGFIGIKLLCVLIPPQFGRLECVAMNIENNYTITKVNLVEVLVIFTIISIKVALFYCSTVKKINVKRPREFHKNRVFLIA